MGDPVLSVAPGCHSAWGLRPARLTALSGQVAPGLGQGGHPIGVVGECLLFCISYLHHLIPVKGIFHRSLFRVDFLAS